VTLLAASRVDWYLTRSTGTVALLLLTGIVVLGVLSPLRVPGSQRWPRFTIGALHRDLSLLALATVALHVVTSVLDSYAPISWLDAVIPFHSSYRPIWLGLGAAAFDLLLALVFTSLVRRRLGYGQWRRIHWLAYACWPLAVVHGLGTGSDAAASWMTIVTLACLGATAAAVTARVARGRILDERWHTLTLAAPAVVSTGIVGFALIGPWQSGWAARAGTPPTLLRGHVASFRVPHHFAGSLTGHERRRTVPGGALLDMLLTVRGTEPGTLRIRLAGRPRGTGVSLVGSEVDLSASDLGGVFQGVVTNLRGGKLQADLRQIGHTGWRVTASLAIDPATGGVTGRLSGSVLR
jgi:methionine sulfoxide reductase heme-binding subunit